MRKRILKFVAVILAIILAVPVLPAGTIANAATKKPALSMTKKTIVGLDASFTLNLKNAGSKVKSLYWYSLDEEIASVEATDDSYVGKVTTVGKGTTKIKCKITYKDGTVVRPACTVTVKIPATAITVSNAKDDDSNNNRHVIAVGETYDFNRTLTPYNANDKTYWSIDNTAYATVDKNGKVTALKAGYIRLTAVAAMSKAASAVSKVDDIINIEIVNKTINVKSVSLTDTTNLKVVFSSPINPTSVIGTDGLLLNTVIITTKTDANNKEANALGTLKGALSADGLTLTITSTNNFDGLYGIRLTDKVLGTDGTALKEYYDNLNYDDKTPPTYVSYTVDATGLKVTLVFSEPMDFTKLAVGTVKVQAPATTATATTLTMLGTAANYIPSTDKKSLTIDLTNITVADRNKIFSVALSGISDLAGNAPLIYPHTVYFGTDTSAKAQARLLSVVRSSYNTLTATYDKAIQTAGTLIVNSFDFPIGVIDPTDPTKVNYTLSATSVLLTGTQKVSIGYWNSFNVSTADTSAYKMYDYYVNFTLDNTVPVLLTSELVKETNNGVDSYILTFTYNKKINLVSTTGSFVSTLVNTNNDIIPNKTLTYSAYAKDKQVIILLNSSQLSDSGTYTIKVPAAFVRDDYMNLSAESTRTIKKDATVSSNLPAPTAHVQSSTNASVVEVVFGNKLDETTAQTASNYYIAGTTISSAVLEENTSTRAVVKLTIAQGTITGSAMYPITISNITGYHNTYSAMTEYKGSIFLNENVLPTYVSGIHTSSTTITLTYSEALAGTPSFKVLQSNSSADLIYNATISGNTIVIYLKSAPTAGLIMLVTPNTSNNITDLAGNAVAFPASYSVYPIY